MVVILQSPSPGGAPYRRQQGPDPELDLPPLPVGSSTTVDSAVDGHISLAPQEDGTARSSLPSPLIHDQSASVRIAPSTVHQASGTLQPFDPLLAPPEPVSASASQHSVGGKASSSVTGLSGGIILPSAVQSIPPPHLSAAPTAPAGSGHVSLKGTMVVPAINPNGTSAGNTTSVSGGGGNRTTNVDASEADGSRQRQGVQDGMVGNGMMASQSGQVEGEGVLTVAVESGSPSPSLITAFVSVPASNTAAIQPSFTGTNLLAMASPSPQAANIFVTSNRLFPLGITAVVIGGLVVLTSFIFIFIRLSGCTKSRNRFNKRSPIPSFIDTEDPHRSVGGGGGGGIGGGVGGGGLRSPSFHGLHRDDAYDAYEKGFETISTNLEKNADPSYGTMPAFTAPASAPMRPARPFASHVQVRPGMGWDTTHLPGRGGGGVASTRPALPQQASASSGFAGVGSAMLAPPLDARAARAEKGSKNGGYRGDGGSGCPKQDQAFYLRAADPNANVDRTGPGSPVPSFRTERLGPFADVVPPTSDSLPVRETGTPSPPAPAPGRTLLRATNPDAHSVSPAASYPSQTLNDYFAPATPARPGGTTAATTTTKPLLRGFELRPGGNGNRDSSSTLSSLSSTTSSLSSYSYMTRAVPFAPDPLAAAPMPPFAWRGTGATGAGVGARERTGSVDVPKDAVSQRGSGAMVERRM